MTGSPALVEVFGCLDCRAVWIRTTPLKIGAAVSWEEAGDAEAATMLRQSPGRIRWTGGGCPACARRDRAERVRFSAEAEAEGVGRRRK